MSLGDRLKLIRGKLSQKEVSNRLNISKGALQTYEYGKRIPNADFVISFCREFKVNANWLLTGDGPIEINDSNLNAQEDMLKSSLTRDKEASKRQATRVKEIGFVIRRAREMGILLDEYLFYINDILDELEKDEPDIRAWFRVEFKKRFPEFFKTKEIESTEKEVSVSAGK